MTREPENAKGIPVSPVGLRKVHPRNQLLVVPFRPEVERLRVVSRTVTVPVVIPLDEIDLNVLIETAPGP